MFHRVETAAGPRAWILLLLIASLSVAPAISQTVEIADLELRQSAEGSELELVADGPLVWTQYRDADSNLVIELPNTVVGEAMEQLESADGLVRSVELMTVENGERPLTRLVVHTSAEAEHTLTVDDSVLHLTFSPPLAVAALESEAIEGSPIVQDADSPTAPGDVSSEPLLDETPIADTQDEEAVAAQTEPTFEAASVGFDALGSPDDPYYAPPPLGVVATRLDGIVVEERDSTSVLRILGDGEFDYSTFWLSDPPRFVVDLEGVVNVSHQNTIPVGTSEVDQVRLAQFQSSPAAVSRVVFDLGSSRAVPVVSRGPDGLVVRFGGDPSGETTLAEVTPDATGQEIVEEDVSWQEPALDESFETAATETEPMALPIEDEPMDSAAPTEAEMDLASEPAIPGLDEPAIVEEEPVVAETSREAPPSRETGSVELFEAQEVTIDTPQTRQEPNQPDFGVRNVGREKQYYGEPISMSLKDADITEVLRSIARLSNLNIVIQPGVSGPVTVELDRVPWDQALEQILKINNLGMQLEGNILRIAPVSQLQQEARAEQELQIARALSVPLRTVMRRINYARAQDIARILTTAQANRGGQVGGRGGAGQAFNPGGILSPRGNVSVDQRTNTLIIQELPDYLDTVIQIIENLDIPERQVMIEARIIETTRNFTRSLGVEWGFLGISSAETGNTTGLQFPNNGTAEGGVNLLTGGDNGFLDISMGNILNTFNLDITLQAAENEGLVNVISAPKVATLNNEQASIQTGLQIPIQTVANNTVTVQFVNATLRLDVTPQITADGTISMDINIQKREPLLAFAIVGATNAPIATREARTRVLVRDGGTAVIGGIYEVSNNDQEGRVPGIANVPILGALFKNKDKSNQNEELLIFITPRVIQL